MPNGREELIDQGIGANQLALGDVAGALVEPIDQGIRDNARGLGRVVRAERRPIDRGIRQTRDALASVTGPLTQQIDAAVSEVAGQLAATVAAVGAGGLTLGSIYEVGCNIGGRATRVELLEGGGIRLTNERGEVSRGRWLADDVIIADDWGGISGRVIGDGTAILWSNGTWWDGCGLSVSGEGSPAARAAAAGMETAAAAPAPFALAGPAPGLPATAAACCCPPVDFWYAIEAAKRGLAGRWLEAVAPEGGDWISDLISPEQPGEASLDDDGEVPEPDPLPLGDATMEPLELLRAIAVQ